MTSIVTEGTIGGQPVAIQIDINHELIDITRGEGYYDADGEYVPPDIWRRYEAGPLTWSGRAMVTATDPLPSVREIDITATYGDKTLAGRAAITGITGGPDEYIVQFKGIGPLTQTASSPGRQARK